MGITHGMATYTERRRIADYEHKEAIVVLHFNVGDNEHYESLLDKVMREVEARARAMLGLGTKELHPKPGHPIANAPGWEAAIDKVAEEVTPELPKPKRGRPKAKPVEEIVDPEDDGPATGEPTTIDDVIDEDDDGELKEEITADDVVTAVKAANAVHANPEGIKKLIRKYAQTSKEIPAEKRADFLKLLEKHFPKKK